jgi:3-hydroxyacyl-CoA dehydrogenase
MTTRYIRRIGVVGAGTMGAAIAALAASAGVPVVLLDVPGGADDRDRNGPAKRGLDRALKARPEAFMDRDRASLISIGNTDDDLGRLADCDWVIEAIIEQLEPKRALYERLEGVLAPTAIVSSNTSGIPMHQLIEGRSDSFRRRFLGTHFFNPPRYLRLLELIPTEETDPAALATVEHFGRRVLGKGTVIARDVPGFIGNRIGLYGIVQTLRLMERFGLTIDEVDALTGPLIGRPRSATFRTADIAGLDVLSHVTTQLAETTGEDFALPEWVNALVAKGALGEKSGAGFYRREGRDILTLDPASGEYRPKADIRTPEIDAIRNLPLEQRLSAALDLPGKYGEFLSELFQTTIHYIIEHTPELAYDLAAVDHALEWGFGWEMGPFRQARAIGAQRDWPEPALLRDGFPAGDALPEGALSLAMLRSEGKVVQEAKEAALLDLGDGVLQLEFTNGARLNALGEGILTMLDTAMKRVESDGYAGLVIANEDPRAFSAGANLALILSLAQEGAWDELNGMIRAFQRAITSLRHVPFPVVVAPAGMALGGGAELVLHADHVQAHAEAYIGLVEAGVGLIPAGGGTKELLMRFTRELVPYNEADPFEAARRAFMLIGMAETSTSALHARKLGFLRHGDRITMNRDYLIADAKAAVLALVPDYVTPQVAPITALGRDTLGNLRYGIWSMHEAGQITDHEVEIGHKLAYVLAGGDGPPREVTEQDLLDLEREAFLSLLGTRKTQERIVHTLKTGKPLRN